MSVVAVVGAQWGDEGKGKVVDLIAEKVDLLVHYAGGANPGQTIVVDGERLVFRLVPTGPLRQGGRCLFAQGMAIDPTMLLEELDALGKSTNNLGELLVCQRAHVVLPHHQVVDKLRDEAEGASGAPRRGVGPCYSDKLARRGVQVGDLLVPERFGEQLRASLDASAPVIEKLGGSVPDPAPIADRYLAAGEKLKDAIIDGSRTVHKTASEGGKVLLEGPYGTMVDIDQGNYPFVIGAPTVAGGACTGTGLAPSAIDAVFGVTKAYSTRAGRGPFPAEVTGALAEKIAQAGAEIDPSTARSRRCGMFDVPALRYAARLNGFSSIALTKLDVLSGLEEIPICVGYELDGEVCDEPPYEGQSRIQPLVEMVPGWHQNLRDCRSVDDLPDNAKRYIKMIEETCGLHVSIISVGPDKSETIVLDLPL